MWILETHIAISVLCWIGIVIMKILYKEEYQRYKGKKRRGRVLKVVMMCFCPVLNVIFTFVFFIMAFLSDEMVRAINERE